MGRWGLHRADLLYRDGKDEDPMMPDDYEVCPDDEALYALAARTKERKGRTL